MTGWKWDADQRGRLTKHRIPTTSMYPINAYLVAFHRLSQHQPTEHEVRTLLSFIDYRKDRHYSTGEKARMAALPFDVCAGSSTIIFHKYGTHDWGYRRPGWQTGSQFTPPSPRVPGRVMGPYNLVQVMDLVDQQDGAPSKEWTQWKKEHSEVFES